jgi:hypothetical protein
VADLSSSSSLHRSIAKVRSVSKMRPGGGTRRLLLRRIQSSAKVEGGFCSDSVRFVDEVESDGGATIGPVPLPPPRLIYRDPSDDGGSGSEGEGWRRR